MHVFFSNNISHCCCFVHCFEIAICASGYGVIYLMSPRFRKYCIILGGCPFHGRVERDEIPTRESPPKQSGTLPCPPLPSPPLHSTPVPSTPLPPLCRLLLSISMHTVCEVGQLNWIGPLSLDYPGVAVRQWPSRPSSRCYFNGPLLHSAYILHSKYCFS